MSTQSLRTVDTARGSMDRANDIADHAARYIVGRADPGVRCVDVRGCNAAEAKRRLYVIRRAARLAEQHRAGDRFELIEAHIASLDVDETP
jgi:hypothetical protein